MNYLPEKKWRVLVIDDNRAIHDDFRKILSPATATAAAFDASEAAVFGGSADKPRATEFEVDSAYQGQEGVTLAAKALEAGRPYAMAFVDVRMPPGWDGVETTQKLWDLDPDLQVVLCTAYSDYSWDEMFQKLGQRDGLLILKKPFDAVEAFQLAHALTEKWWLHQQSRQKMEELESRVAERTQELARSLSLLNATLESTTDGIVVVDLAGKVISYNTRFAATWQFPAGMLERRDAAEMRAHAAGQVKDSTLFLRRTKELQADPEAEGFDEIELKDGRTFERYVFPQRIDGECVGTVINWRDITERRRAEESLRKSEEKFRQLADNVTDVFYMTSPDLQQMHYVSPAYEHIWGRTTESLYANPSQWSEAILPEERAKVIATFSRLATDDPSVSMEFQIARPDGAVRWILSRCFQVRDAGGKVIRITGIASDITERKLTENALRESNEKFQQLADNITDAFWIRSPDMREVHYISPAFERIWGRSRESLYAHPQQWADFILPEDRERALAAFAALTGDAPSLDIEYRIVRPSGEIRWVRVRGFQVRDAADKLIRHAGIVTDITERHRAAEELQESERRFNDMLRNLELVSMMLDQDARITWCNDYLLRVTGWQREEVIGRDWFDLFIPPEHFEELRAVHSALLADQPNAWHHENEIVTQPGARRLIRWNNSVLRSASGEVTGTASIGEDITERKRLEAQLFQSQKLETVGKLAGGIAHEFNNIMTAVIGQSELMLGELPAGSPLARNATQISMAAGRAVTLTRQLLAYGRKQILQPKILDLNSVLADMESTLRRLMGRVVEVRIAPAAGLKLVRADAGQIEQVILNITMNAADAMPAGGKLTLETANVSFDHESVDLHPDLKPGDYVMLAITDTGTGMSAEAKARAFEPFFTTKGIGQGTGLGLSTCYGIIKQSGGHITVYSEPVMGTIFKIYLPQIESHAKIPSQRLDSPDLPRGTETILLVEDDPALREMAATLLKRLGYTVLAAANGIEALSLKRRRDIGQINLLFSDAIMPQMSGQELADRVRVFYPEIRILFTSAYTENGINHQDGLHQGAALLQKPFTPSALARKLREVLDE